MFRRSRRDPEPVYSSQLWNEQHLVWPVERSLLAAFRDYEDFNRRPRVEVPRDFKDPNTSGVVVHLAPAPPEKSSLQVKQRFGIR